ncbi:hypothetical protein KFK09_026586 [Dendrobium nobile]|uniref:Uncharacterized protein n=1 Tax=Dendrobium nobile TaxID=94219 RepID=A0A8T3ADA9_DENNO|nr:hypothetical protein KFK09_026586 [Dendrobium nobile]
MALISCMHFLFLSREIRLRQFLIFKYLRAASLDISSARGRVATGGLEENYYFIFGLNSSQFCVKTYWFNYFHINQRAYYY